MHRLHSGLTVAVAIKDGKSTDLRAILRSLNKSIVDTKLRESEADTSLAANKLCDFENSETTLVISGVVIPAQNYHGETLPSTLVFATTYTGTLDNHLQDLVKSSGAGLCQVFENCHDFPDNEAISDNDLISFLKSHNRTGAFGSRYSCITKQEVKKEKELRKEIEDYLDNAQEFGALDNRRAKDIQTLIQRHIKAQGDRFNWARKPARASLIEFLTKNKAIILIIILAFVIIIPVVLVNPESLGWFLSIGLGLAIIIDITVIILIIAYVLRFYIARSKNITASRPADDLVRQVTSTQLRPIINEMTAAAPLKKGFLRRHFYAKALDVIGFAGDHLMKVPTVSSLRWLSIDNRKRLLFLSNYSNTTDFYVREFLNGKTPLGVNFMFTNGVGFPDAKLLREGGITEDPEGYMNVIHTHQHPTELWYMHDYEITIDQILKNRKIRNGLFKKMNEMKTTEWLRLF
jgi:hypothetical protein